MTTTNANPAGMQNGPSAGVSVSRRRQNAISTMWTQLAAIRCWESWKDYVWKCQVLTWTRDKFELASLIRLQVSRE